MCKPNATFYEKKMLLISKSDMIRVIRPLRHVKQSFVSGLLNSEHAIRASKTLNRCPKKAPLSENLKTKPKILCITVKPC